MQNEIEYISKGSFPFLNDTLTKEIKIKNLEYRGKEELDPCFAYIPTRFGQANYIIKRCQEQNIKVKFFANELQIFSKRKLSKLVEIIKESMEYDDIPYPIINEEISTYTTGRGILGIFIKEEDTFYCHSKTFHYTINHIFKRQLPRPIYYKILDNEEDLRTYLLYEKDIAI